MTDNVHLPRLRASISRPSTNSQPLTTPVPCAPQTPHAPSPPRSPATQPPSAEPSMAPATTSPARTTARRTRRSRASCPPCTRTPWARWKQPACPTLEPSALHSAATINEACILQILRIFVKYWTKIYFVRKLEEAIWSHIYTTFGQFLTHDLAETGWRKVLRERRSQDDGEPGLAWHAHAVPAGA